MSSLNSTNSTPILPPFPIYSKPWSVVSIILNMLGLFGNGNIIIATIRGKNLKNKCNYLIAINAVFDFCANVGFFQTSSYGLMDNMMMPNDVCYQRLSFMIFTMNTGAFLIWTIGLDRWLAIKFATSYHKWQTEIYLFLMVLPALAYSMGLTAVGFGSSSPDEYVLMCMPPTAIMGIAANLWTMTGVFINVLVIFTYGWVFVLVRKQARITDLSRQTVEGGFDPMRRLTESLLIIMIVYILGWLITMTVLLLISNVGVSPSVGFHCALYVGWNASISVTCNYYIYFMRSAEYAQLFKEQLGCWQEKAVSVRPKVSTTAVQSAFSSTKRNSQASFHA